MYIKFDLKSNAVLNFYIDYLDLMFWLVTVYNDPKRDFRLFIHLYNGIKKKGQIIKYYFIYK
jgi:hypothetical protein